jgi:hypothetical protein
MTHSTDYDNRIGMAVNKLTTAEKSEVDSALGDMDSLLNRLDEIASSLRSKLAPILKQIPENDSPSVATPESSVPLAREIQGRIGRIFHITQELESMHRRVGV